MIWNISKILVAVRLDSSRLPGKAFLEINGEKIIEILLNNLQKEISKENIILCTSDDESQKPLIDFCELNNYKYFAGNKNDVMKRFLDCAKFFNLENIIRVTGDNPLTDPELLVEMLKYHTKNKSEYTYNVDYPIGTRSEIINVSALERVHANINCPDSTEYMTYMLKRPDKLNVKRFDSDINNYFSNFSLTLDTEEDFLYLKKLFTYFDYKFSNIKELINLLLNNKSLNVELRYNKLYKLILEDRFLYKNDKSKSISYHPCL
jgi:spore coat polysaccharide biosynthesis protein SpsF (cytidylyltransferase family)